MKKLLFCYCLLFFVSVSSAAVSTNVPLSHWSYDDIDRLRGAGLIDGSLVGTRPYTRLEVARQTAEAIGKFEELEEQNEITGSILTRLKREFKDELISLKVIGGHYPTTFLKPLDTVSVRYLHAHKDTLIENNEGDDLSAGSNGRLKFSTRAKLWDHLALYLQPEFELKRDEGDELYEQELREYHGKLEMFNIEIEGGRDSMWWGPGRHGSLLLTDNAKPYEYIIKISNPRPVLLPWIFKYMGPFQITLFGAGLEEDRSISQAKLLGQRINFKPHPVFEIGLSRTYQWGGKDEEESGKKFWDGFKTKGGTGGTITSRNNYLAGMDFTLTIPHIDRYLPVTKTLTLYGELGSDDELGGFLSEEQMAYLAGGYFGDLFLTGRTDVRIEYAVNNPDSNKGWYTHSVYRSGYTYKGEIIGHHMGTNAKDIFVRMTHYITKDWLIGLDYDREWRSYSANTRARTARGINQLRDQLGGDLSFIGFDGVRLQGFYRFEHIRNANFVNGDNIENHTGGGEVIYTF